MRQRPGPIFAAPGVIGGVVDPAGIDPGGEQIRIGMIGAAFGFISGALFGVVLSVAERGKSILDLPLRR